MEFGNRLYELRKQRGMSQEELAEVLEVTRQTISKWEVGDSSPDMAKLIAMGAFFGISLDELILGIKPEKSAGENPWKKLWTVDREKKMKIAIRWGRAAAAVLLTIDAVSFIVCLCLGLPL